MVWHFHRRIRYFCHLAHRQETHAFVDRRGKIVGRRVGVDPLGKYSTGGDNGLIFNVGFRQALTEHVALIGSAGRSINGPLSSTPTFQGYLGVQLTC
jgi:hypothetical protein